MSGDREPTGWLRVCHAVGGGGFYAAWDEEGVIVRGRLPACRPLSQAERALPLLVPGEEQTNDD